MDKLQTTVIGGILFVAGLTTGVLWKNEAAREKFVTVADDANQRATEIQSAYEYIREKHVGKEVTDKQLYEGAIKGMIGTLGDPHTRYFDTDQAVRHREEYEGKYFGVGVSFVVRNGALFVSQPLEGPLVSDDVLQDDDQIVAVNGKPAKDMNVVDAESLSRGKEGAEVIFEVLRADEATPRVIVATCHEIKVASVKHEVLVVEGRRVLLITITGFHEDTAEIVNEAARETREMPVVGVILDLRDNPGGLLSVAKDVVCNWLTSGIVVITEKRDQSREELSCVAWKRAPLEGIPTVVLVNHNTASASEITAGALRDHHLAHLIGETTFGKGVGQEAMTMPDGSQIWLTTFNWFTPNGQRIHGIGISPDETVPINTPMAESAGDQQVASALEYLTAARSPAQK